MSTIEHASMRFDTGFVAELAEAGTSLLGGPVHTLEVAIRRVLARMVETLSLEFASLCRVDPVDGRLRLMQRATAAGTPHAHRAAIDGECPRLLQRLREDGSGVLLLKRGDELLECGWPPGPRAADGNAAVLAIASDGRLLGALAFGSSRADETWPEALVNCLRLISHIVAAALLRIAHHGSVPPPVPDSRWTGEFGDIVGESSELRAVLYQAQQVAVTDAAVLLLGETGTGKELIAKAIHARSPRSHRPMVSVNCAALPATLIESELFGHEKGAFTGAIARKIGRFELADQGTLFLDEVGELPLVLQAKLLRALQEGEFERLGSSVTRKFDARIIAASNRDLKAAAQDGTFRADLFYRLSVFPIRVPPLRARKDDIPLLVWHTLDQLRATLGKTFERVPADAMDRLVRYDWPGNIRELRNVIERAAILSPGTSLHVDELLEPPRAAGASAGSTTGRLEALEDVERAHILRTLSACDWRVRGADNAAQRLGLNASTLYSRMKKLGIRRATAGRSPAPSPAAAIAPGE